VTCPLHRGSPMPCTLCQLEARLPELHDHRLRAIARYVESIPDRVALSGKLQGRCLVIAGELKELAGLLEAA
jgi:hypothetical protein